MFIFFLHLQKKLKMTDINIGKDLRTLRESKGLKQADIAKLMNRKRPYISYIENSKLPSLSVIIDYCNALNVKFKCVFFE